MHEIFTKWHNALNTLSAVANRYYQASLRINEDNALRNEVQDGYSAANTAYLELSAISHSHQALALSIAPRVEQIAQAQLDCQKRLFLEHGLRLRQE